jgi:adenylate cyclase
MGLRVFQGALIGTAAATVALVLWVMGFLDLWEFATWRWRVEFFAKPSASSSTIKLILLDQNSLAWAEEENGWSWPWPREVYSPIIDFCERSGARAVIFDLLFTESSLYGVDDDKALAAAIDRGPAFITPLFLGKKSGDLETWPPETPLRFSLRIANLDEWLALGSHKEAVMPRAAFPVPEVSNSCAILASVSQEPDIDGIFRRCHLFHLFDGHVIPSFGLAAFLAGRTGDGSRGQAAQPGGRANSSSSHEIKLIDGCLMVAGRSVPMDALGKSILRFRGPAGSYETFSAASVIQSELRIREGAKPVIENMEVFKDAYVFVGGSAPGLLDLRPTPIGKIYPGVELHATMLDNLLSNDFLQEAVRWNSFLTTFLLALLSGVLVVFGRKAWQSAVAVGVFLSLPVLIGFLAYPLGYWWPMIVHEAAVAFSLTGAVLFNYASEGRQKAFIKKAFTHYLSPEVIKKILEDPSKLRLGGERRELSIFFSDLQGFSSISERLDPHTLTTLLNDYLSDMTDIILEEGGTLDKYEGDAIIAFWNAPLDQPDHALRACRAAIRCQIKLKERREEFMQRTGAMLYARIGINTGPVVVGNMGSRKRFDYTVLGDAANLASRLEGANKVFDTFLMVSEATWEQTANELLGRELGMLRVVGRKTPVRVYELIGLSAQEDSDKLESFRSALAMYYARDLTGALQIFDSLPDDPVAKHYAKRCRALLQNPSSDWDGVWNLTEK